MNFKAAEQIASALLYEGYLLYPFRASSVKNQRRWTFGCLFPPDFPQPPASSEGSDMLAECLLNGDPHTAVMARARFLHLQTKQDWDEAEERLIETPVINLLELTGQMTRIGFSIAGTDHQQAIAGTLDISAERIGDDLFKLRAKLANVTGDGINALTRETALPRAFISSHLMLGVSQRKFLSSQDPPNVAANCRNIRAWPILVGDSVQCDTMLAAPIILSDFPQVAAQSPGDLFDGTEMDEMLTLRIRTLTPDEKQEMAALDPRADLLLRRSEALSHEQLLDLHGTWRQNEKAPSPIATVCVSGVEIEPGARVRLKPRGRADVFDLALTNMTAVVVSIEQDFEDQVYLSVVIDEDPGRDFGMAGQPGHRFYFRPDEVEPIKMPRILIAGIGNIFLGDDAFGVEVVRRLAELSWPMGITVKDFGIRGFDLACALQDGYDMAILVDAIGRSGPPGTLHVIEPDTEPSPDLPQPEMHGLDLVQVIRLVQQMGGRLPRLRLVGCEPATLEPAEDGRLSNAVREAVPNAIALIEALVAKLLKDTEEAG